MRSGRISEQESGNQTDVNRNRITKTGGKSKLSRFSRVRLAVSVVLVAHSASILARSALRNLFIPSKRQSLASRALIGRGIYSQMWKADVSIGPPTRKKQTLMSTPPKNVVRGGVIRVVMAHKFDESQWT
ncbi:hypothetical protein Ancab_017228 [Ancistrocladus abbreviatus]